MKDFSLLRVLLQSREELESYALVPEDFYVALDELIYRVIEFVYNKMSEERA